MNEPGANRVAQQSVGQLDMDATSRPHLLGQKWRLVHNMRAVDTTLKQVPLLKDAFDQELEQAVQGLAFLPCDHKDFGYWLCFSPSYVNQLREPGFLVDQNGNYITTQDGLYIKVRDSLQPLNGSVFELPSSVNYADYRWAVCTHNNRVFFTNRFNSIRYSNGAQVRELYENRDDVPAIPSGDYLIPFFDHLIVGAPTYKGMHLRDRIMWSSLDDYAQWEPDSDNEADSYICTEFQREDDQLYGVTGLCLWNNMAVIGTDSAMYALQYTGLPRIMRAQPYVTGYGNGLRYAMTSMNDAVVFVDTQHRSFFALRGSPIEDFGYGIKDYFFSDLNSDFALQQRTWCYVNRKYNEVVWVYVSGASSGAFDKAVAFNYGNKTWSVRAADNLSSYCKLGRRATADDELVGTIDSLAGTMDELVEGTETLAETWGTQTLSLVAEVAGNDDDDVISAAATPVLESGDFVFETMQHWKEVSQMLLHCTAGSYAGVQVEVSVRDNVDAVVVWEDVGTWTATIKEKTLTFRPRVGRVIRYRFTPLAAEGTYVRDFVFSAFVDGLVAARATR